jgi:hypothetical protein
MHSGSVWEREKVSSRSLDTREEHTTHRLGRLVDEDRPKLELGQPRISTSNTSAANDIGVVENLPLARPGQRLELPLIARAQLPLTLLELNELLQLGVRVRVGDLGVEGEVRDGRLERLARFGRHAHDLESRGVDLLGELVDGDVRGGADEDLAGVHLGEVIDDRGGGDCLSGTGRSLSSAD